MEKSKISDLRTQASSAYQRAHRLSWMSRQKLIDFARKPLREQMWRVGMAVRHRLFRGTGWVAPEFAPLVESDCHIRLGNDRTAYIMGLKGGGRWYLNELVMRNVGERAKYFSLNELRFHPGPTSMIYSGHATIRHVSRDQRLPETTARILESVRSGCADLIFYHRHPLDSLLTNWVHFRTAIRYNFPVEGVSQAYKNSDDLCVDLERNFADFDAFAKGDPSFFAGLSGPRFLSFEEFVEETTLYLRCATLALRFEDFAVDPSKELSKVLELMSVDVGEGRLQVAPPLAKPYGHVAVAQKVPEFKKFIDELSGETKRAMERMRYDLPA